MSNIAKRTLAFNPERMRAVLWHDFAIPESLLQEAVDELRKQVKAKKVEYFAWHGEIVSKRVVKDNAARQGAIDKILSMTGAYVRERDVGRNDNNAVTIEIGEDGVHRIIINAQGAPAALPPESEDAYEMTRQLTDGMASGPTSGAASQALGHEAEPEVHRVSRDTPRENVIQLFKDPEPDGDGRIQ